MMKEKKYMPKNAERTEQTTKSSAPIPSAPPSHPLPTPPVTEYDGNPVYGTSFKNRK